MTDSADQTLPVVQAAFARLTRENSELSDIDRRIMRAFEQLMLGRPEITDGRTSAVNICAEAGVSRASYYRSPVSAAIKEVLGAPQAKRPEADELRQEIARLKKTVQELRSEKAVEIRELRSTVAAYANQIQILALRNAQLEADAQRLQAQVAGGQERVVRQLKGTRTPTETALEQS
ncbi:hypothetical protein [Streptomyces sp. NPDC050804]|uniref:hypothetical protein n=1 Tax=Streptomyces sp. NPDC050804 TaxID=3154745 RepID=UPI00343C10FF